MNLPPYNPDATCLKCGHDDISTGYRRSGYDCSYPRRCGTSQFDGEHHDRYCRRCSFEWAESVIEPRPSASGAGDAGEGG